MKLSRLETHDRLIHLKEDQSKVIAEGAEECLKRNPLSLALQEKSDYVYIFAHPRTAEDGVNKRLIWQPRLGKPTAEPNSYLFRAISKSDMMEVCWILPDKTQWGQHKKGNVTESSDVTWSINQYLNNKVELERSFHDDLPEARIREIYRQIATEMEEDIRTRKMRTKPVISEAYESYLE